jgi:hypothetical protein
LCFIIKNKLVVLYYGISKIPMNQVSSLLFFSVFVLIIGSGSLALADEGLTVSNIGSSGQDGATSNIGSSGQDGVSVKTVPPWIKTSMEFWVKGQTSDTEFLNAVEFLATEKIITVAEPASTAAGFDTEMVALDAHAETSGERTVQTEILSMDLTGHDSFFDVFYETYSVDSFFDVFTELQESSDSFFDVFFEVDTPRVNDCPNGEVLVFDDSSSSWRCASPDRVDSFFDVFFDVTTETAQNSEDIDELERKIAVLEKKIEELESADTQTRPAT